ncbi:OLC1v1025403C2 [Oldenlandia corymbosa var. corymbosa]|uniref:OLC1v1025403C2 n=1 Tax=Oldenlandia corymbosa var. corymbosa TaxID=529605 RepID=A0AAV1C4N1_OLDCO|nr:OLC1v1025403C2 [Oldenlandia corymbosa var. corymbosa]
MERNLGQDSLGQQKNYEQVRYSSVETRTEGLGFANQRFFHDPSSSINTNIRPPELGIPVLARPVLNYSIQTGEEFSFEFMRDRVNPRQQFMPNVSGAEPGGSSYMDLKGILGISSSAASENGSDISMIPPAQKIQAQVHERNNSFANEEKGFYQPVPPVPRSSSRNSMNHGSSRAPQISSPKLKFLCSFGGRIMPRPSDGKLRYVGGETRIIRLSKDVSWEDLLQKSLSIYSQTQAIKYQLPGEDLDALVSVSCNEDLQNMIDECNVLEDSGSQKPRMFLFSSSDLDDSQLALGNVEPDSEFQYVVAVNGMDFGSRRNSIALASTSQNNLDELLGFSVGREMNQVTEGLAGINATQPRENVYSSDQSTQQIAPVFSHFESHPLNYHNNKTQGDVEWHPVTSFQYTDSSTKTDVKTFVQPASTLKYETSHGSNHHMIMENLVPHSNQGHIALQGGQQPHGSLYVNYSDQIAAEMTVNREKSIKKAAEFSADQSVEKNALSEGTQMRRENSTPKINETEKMQSSGNTKIYTSNDMNASNSIAKDDASVVSPADFPGPVVTPKASETNQKPVQKSVPPVMVEEEKVDKFNEDGHLYLSGNASADGYGDLNASPNEPSVLPQRVFRSERIPREQSGLNRLSKSDDSYSNQFLIAHTQSDVSLQYIDPVDLVPERNADVADSTDKMQEKNVGTQTKEYIASGDPQQHHSAATGNNQQRQEKSGELYNKVSVPSSSISREVSESNLQTSEEKAPVIHDKESYGLSNQNVSQEISGKVQGESTSKVKDLPFGEMPVKRMEGSNKKVQIIPAVEREQPIASISEEKPSTGVPEQGDILIDINDRFPPDFLSDMFSLARNDTVTGVVLPTDRNGLSLNMENHEPKHWSFFQKLAQDDFVRRDVSLMDQDHIGFPIHANVVEGIPVEYVYPQTKDVVSVGLDSHMNFHSNIQQPSRGFIGPNTMNLPSDYDPPPTTSIQSMQFDDGIINSRVVEPDYQDEKVEAQHTGYSLINLSLADFDPSSLQIIKNEDLEELRELGSGTFGTVYHGKWRGTDVAIKRIKKTCFTGRSSEQERLTVEFWREAEILSKLHHPNVVAFYGVVEDGPGGTLATVTEFMVNGSLRHVLLSKDRHLDRRKRAIIASDAAFGMEYLHSKNIVHFDLKCDNLLVNLKDPSRPICKVGDFGLSKIKRNTLVTGGVRGTLPWMAPELLNGSSSKVSEKVDVFSFGIVLWEILTGEEPYANMHYGAIIGLFDSLQSYFVSSLSSRNILESVFSLAPVTV